MATWQEIDGWSWTRNIVPFNSTSLNWGQSEPTPTSALIGHFIHKMGYVSSFNSWPFVNPTLYHSQPFWVADLWPFLFFGCFFPNLHHITFQLNHPSFLATLLTLLHYWFASQLYLQPLTYLSFIFSWLNLYLLAKLLPFGTTFNSSWLNLHLFMAKHLHVDKITIYF